MSPVEGFDPLADLLVASQARPESLADINLRTLSPYQRALLATDGTVTKFIESFMMEPVDITLLSEGEHELTADHPWLDTPAGTTVISREVVLRGRHSRTFYAHAVSLLAAGRLPDEMRRTLPTDRGGIGRWLQNSKLETRREILWYGRETVADLPAAAGLSTDGRFISRTYRIIAGSPIMLINERFPLSETGTGLQGAF
jgi:chorismate-pyruvate lyase